MNINKRIKEAFQKAVERGEYKCPVCDGEGIFKPCSIGCYNHVSHPCENCGRLQGKCNSCNGTKIDQNKNIPELLMGVIGEISKSVDACRYDKFYEGNEEFLEFLMRLIEKDCKSDFMVHFEGIKNTHEDHLAGAYIKLMELCGYLGLEIDASDLSFLGYCPDNKSQSLFDIVELVVDLRKSKIDYVRLRYILNQIDFFCKKNNIDIDKHIEARMKYEELKGE